MEKSLKETLELVKALEVVAVKGIEISKIPDVMGKLAKGAELLKEVDMIIEGVKGLDGVVEEVKDLDQAELLQLGTALFAAYKNVKKAL